MMHSNALLLTLASLALGACSGDAEKQQTEQTKTTDTETQQEMPAQRPPAREGPDGCYIPSRQKCDCAIQEDACTPDVGVWTQGCASCAM